MLTCVYGTGIIPSFIIVVLCTYYPSLYILINIAFFQLLCLFPFLLLPTISSLKVLSLLSHTLPETGSLPSATWFAECFFSGTRQRRLCGFFAECFFFWHSAKSLFAECYFFYTRQRKFQSTFWSSKLIQMKKFSTTKLYNSSRCTMFVLVFSSYDKVKVNLFTNLTYLSCSLWNYKRDI